MSFNFDYEPSEAILFDRLNQRNKLAVKVYSKKLSAQELINQA